MEEFIMSTGRNPKGLFRTGIVGAEHAYCGLVDGIPACVYGLTIDTEGVAAPWFMGTPAIGGVAVSKAMLTIGRFLFPDWADRYGTLRNWAYAKNDLHIRYIEALGCEVEPPAPRGPLLAPFREFNFRV